MLNKFCAYRGNHVMRHVDDFTLNAVGFLFGITLLIAYVHSQKNIPVVVSNRSACSVSSNEIGSNAFK